MNRRHFLTRSGLALGALIVGDAALEELARLTHVRKSFPSAGVTEPYVTLAEANEYMRELRFVVVEGDTHLSGDLYATLHGRTSRGAPWREIERVPADFVGGNTITFKTSFNGRMVFVP